MHDLPPTPLRPSHGPAAPLRWIVLAVVIAAVISACSSSGGASQAATPGPALVTTPEAAMAAIVAAEPRFTGIGPRDPNLIGQSAWFEAQPASGVGAFIVDIVVGWGDCPAGCIEQHVWRYSVAPDGTVTLQEESGDPLPADGLPLPADGGWAPY